MKIIVDNEADAARFWINRDWSMIPTSLIEKAYGGDPEQLELIASPRKLSDCCDAPVESLDGTDDNGEPMFRCESCSRHCGQRMAPAEYAWPAAHGWMFHPEDDEDWIRTNAEEIAEKCGLFVYDAPDGGILLGIDGGGYSFYDEHWIPLYRLRGLKWHETQS